MSILPVMLPAMRSVLSTGWEVDPVCNLKIRRIWELSYGEYKASGHIQSHVQQKASHAIMDCKSGRLGANLSQCPDCEHLEFHNNSCRSRNCQAVQKEVWVDKRRAEVIDAPYFNVVFTLPHELNPLIYYNQQLLCGFLHRCCAQTLLELSPAESIPA